MQKVFIRGLVITLLLNLLVKPATIFGVDVVMQNRLGSEAYGIYFTVLNFTFLFSMLLDMGVTNYMTRLISQHPHLIRQYSHQLFTLRLVLAGAYIIWTTLLFFIIGWPIQWLWILGLLLLHQININTVNYVRAYTGGLMRFALDAVLSVTERLVYLVLGVIVLYTSFVEELSLVWFVGIMVGASFLSLVGSVFVYIALVEFPKWKWNTIFFQAIFKQSIPYAVLVILMMLCVRLDAVFLERLHPDGKRQVGYYVQGFRLLDACWMFGILFGSLLLPVFSRLLKEKNSVSAIMTNAFNILVGGGILMIVLSFGMLRPLFDMLYDDVAEVSYHSWTFLALAFIPMCFTIVFGTLLTANGSMKQLNIIAGCGLAINITLHCILAPMYGALGTAITTFVTQLALGLTQWWVIRYTMHHRLEPRAWMKLIALSVIMTGMLCAQWTYHFNIFYWGGAALALWTLCIFGLRIIDLQKMLALVVKNKD